MPARQQGICYISNSKYGENYLLFFSKGFSKIRITAAIWIVENRFLSEKKEYGAWQLYPYGFKYDSPQYSDRIIVY